MTFFAIWTVTTMFSYFVLYGIAVFFFIIIIFLINGLRAVKHFL